MATGHLIRYKSALVAAAASVAAILCVAPAHAVDAHRLDLSMPKIVFAVYGEHVSHISQHHPFTSDPSSYGYNTVNVSVTFERHGTGGGPFLTLAEGYNISAHADESYYTGHVIPTCLGSAFSVECSFAPVYAGQPAYGALLGPREVFSARFGWRWTLN